MSKKAPPKISVIIVNFNGKKYLQSLLPQLVGQTYKKIEVIVVDNNSSDHSRQYIQKYHPQVKLVVLARNQGFASGNNAGFKVASGEWIFLLNNDTFISKNFFENLLCESKKIPQADIIQPLILRENGSIDSCGSYWTSLGILYHYGYGKNFSPKYNRPSRVFSVMGAAMLIKRSVIEDIGLFDATFWSYYEETDFCHRAWLAGYQSWYMPKPSITHIKGGTSVKMKHSKIQFHNFKNKYRSFLKNFSIMRSCHYVIVSLLINSIFGLFQLFARKDSSILRAHSKAVWWNLVHLKDTISHRKKSHHFRKQSDIAILQKVKRNPRVSYYAYLLSGLENYSD